MTDIRSGQFGRVPMRMPGPKTLLLAACLTIATALLLLTAARGFDVWDEAYYIALIVEPGAFTSNLHAFCLPVHLAFVALGRSIVALRILGVLVLLASGGVLGAAIKRYYGALGLATEMPRFILLGTLFSLTYYVFWVETPSYNLLVNACAALVVAGALYWMANDRIDSPRRDDLASVLIGIGGGIGFFAKAPFAALAAVGVAFLLARTALKRGWPLALRRGSIVGAVCSALLVAVLESTVGITRFLDMARQTLTVLRFGNSPLELPMNFAGQIYGSPPIFLVTLTGFALVLAWHRGRKGEHVPAAGLRHAALVLLIVDLAFGAVRILYRIHIGDSPWLYVGLATFCAVLGMLTYGLTRPEPQRLPAAALTPLWILLLVPFTTSIGTANPLMVQLGVTLFPMLLAMVAGGWLLFGKRGGYLIELAAALYAVGIVFVAAALPYYLPRSIFAQTEPVSLPFTPDTLYVDHPTKIYVEELRRIAAVEKLGADTPIMDLSGNGPGTALVLNNRAPFFPWVLPMFPNSAPIADAIWDSMTPRQQSEAWIVGPVDGRLAHTRIAAQLKRRQHEYRKIGRLMMDYGEGRGIITLWRPIAPDKPRR